LFKQLLISVIVLVAAAAGWIYFVPGAHDTLSQVGINVPFGPGSGQVRLRRARGRRQVAGPQAVAPVEQEQAAPDRASSP
jgi:hypothetical protein